jgi:hypothetical protein
MVTSTKSTTKSTTKTSNPSPASFADKKAPVKASAKPTVTVGTTVKLVRDEPGIPGAFAHGHRPQSAFDRHVAQINAEREQVKQAAIAASKTKFDAQADRARGFITDPQHELHLASGTPAFRMAMAVLDNFTEARPFKDGDRDVKKTEAAAIAGFSSLKPSDQTQKSAVSKGKWTASRALSLGFEPNSQA